MYKLTDLDYQLLKEKYPNNLEEILKKINDGYPIQYLIGNVSFYGYQINVNQKVLIPRFETEYLIEKVLKKLSINNPKVLDIGTGSGCIAIVIKKELPDSKITAIDIDQDALSLAKKNAILNKVKIDFKVHPIENGIKDKYDLIISNPPYIGKEEKIMDKVYNYEPHKALFAPNHGLYFYELILQKAINHLNEKGIIAFEIGANQKEEITEMARKYFLKAKISCEKDLTGKNRYFFIETE